MCTRVLVLEYMPVQVEKRPVSEGPFFFPKPGEPQALNWCASRRFSRDAGLNGS